MTVTHPNLLLLSVRDGPEIKTTTNTQIFLLLCVQDDPAITLATYINSKLQLIDASTLSTLIKLIVDFIPFPEGTQQVICNDSFKLIVKPFSEGESQPINRAWHYLEF